MAFIRDAGIWSNRLEVCDGIVSFADVSQDPDLFENDTDEEKEMED